MNKLAVFDIDGTLTRTNAVDDECYAKALAEVLGLTESEVEWTEAPHVTDSGILAWLVSRRFGSHNAGQWSPAIRDRFLSLLNARLLSHPELFMPVEGADQIFDKLRSK